MILKETVAVSTVVRKTKIELLPYNPTNNPFYSVDENKSQIEFWKNEKDPFRDRPGFNLRIKNEVENMTESEERSRQFHWRCSETNLQFIVNIIVYTKTGDWQEV